MKNDIQTEDCCVPKGPPESDVEIAHLERYKFACRYVKDKRVLDIACGAGYGSNMLKLAGASNVLGGDISSKNVQYCSVHYKAEDLEFKQIDICKPILEKEFDVVVCFETIEHLKDYKVALININNVLSRNGLLIISSPNRQVTEPYLKQDDKPSSGHEREFTSSELMTILRDAGFGEIDYFGQRMQICFDSPFIEKNFKRLFKPHKWSSQIVCKVRNLTPEYIVMVARKKYVT